ncbi:hypothetical protein M8818_001686 [Zalaria obscura]|uniref:Uncharacterized protein n=1 Tax=Zalaria obscura TaxID=2024903 RepID=A0ACC3SK62_9PEZI
MATHFVDAHVAQSTIKAHNQRTSLSKPFTQFFPILAEESYDQYEQPPAKRRRIDSETDGDTPSLRSEVPVVQVVVRLHLSEADDGTALTEVGGANLQKTAEIEVRAVESLDGGRVRFMLAGPQTGICLSFETESEFDLGAVEELTRLAFLDKRARKSRREHVVRPLCQLRRLNGSNGQAFALDCRVFWRDGASLFGPLGSRSGEEAGLLWKHFSPPTSVASHPWTPQEFYDSVYAPPINQSIPHALDAPILDSDLYPFQKRAVRWMLEREGLRFHDGELQRANRLSDDNEAAFSSFVAMKDALGNECFVSHLQGVIASRQYLEGLNYPKGGILAEEMGLGKTCELIALSCLNKRPVPMKSEWSTDSTVAPQHDLIPSRATLIVTPPTILQQWKDELNRHAPSLAVLDYKGISASLKRQTDEQNLLDDFSTKDVVLTTYNVLAREVHFAVDPPDRNLRQRKNKIVRRRSPLVRMHWWRVCLDEAQQVESGVSAAARVAALLPREHAWAVSGTPLRKDVQDLHGLLIFLGYYPFCDSTAIWSRLIGPYRDDFKALFGRIALRHTKDKIRQELRLPPQKRVVITIPFNAVEEQNYRSLFEEMCEDCGCSPDGGPLHEDWDPNSPLLMEKMRTWLVRLRQTCLHPQVGGRNRRALGRGAGPLRTVAEVLEVMIEQNEVATRTEARALILNQLLCAHIVGNDGSDEHRSEKALELYRKALQASEELAEECRRQLAAAEAAEDIPGISRQAHDEDTDEDESPDHSAKLRYRSNLRSALELQHACAFFTGTAYYQIKSNEKITDPESERFHELEGLEASHYDAAKAIRKELLQENSGKAEKLMRKIPHGETQGALTQVQEVPNLSRSGGIENRKIIERLAELRNILNAQGRHIESWRGKIVDLILRPLVDEDEGKETTGEEYEDSTKQMDTLYAYIDAFRAIVADRSTCLTGQTAPLIDHEMNVLARDAQEDKGHDPKLLLELLSLRNDLKQKGDLISIRGLMHEIRGLETAVQFQEGTARSNAEIHILQGQMAKLQSIQKLETKTMAGLEKEVELFRATMNQRLEFYRQLQHISDTVAPYREELDPELDRTALEGATTKEEAMKKSLAALRTKHRFLLHLREESSSQEGPKICVICQCSFEQGVLTVCGHQYCKECIQHWWSQHRTCPVCKRHLSHADFHPITYKPQELRAQEETRKYDPGASNLLELDLEHSLPDRAGALLLSTERA